MNTRILSALLSKADAPMTDRRPIHGHAGGSRDRLDARVWIPLSAIEEALVVDDRSSLTSAQMLENKLTRVLGKSPVPVSQLRTRRLLSNR